jgi:hypothetical protein
MAATTTRDVEPSRKPVLLYYYYYYYYSVSAIVLVAVEVILKENTRDSKKVPGILSHRRFGAP